MTSPNSNSQIDDAQTADDADQVSLWSAPSSFAERDVERCRPLVLELVRASGTITVDDVRRLAVERGIFTGSETGRRLSFLGSLCRSCGLIPTGEYRRSTIAGSNGNLHTVWRLPSHASEGAA